MLRKYNFKRKELFELSRFYRFFLTNVLGRPARVKIPPLVLDKRETFIRTPDKDIDPAGTRSTKQAFRSNSMINRGITETLKSFETGKVDEDKRKEMHFFVIMDKL